MVLPVDLKLWYLQTEDAGCDSGRDRVIEVMEGHVELPNCPYRINALKVILLCNIIQDLSRIVNLVASPGVPIVRPNPPLLLNAPQSVVSGGSTP